MNPTFIDAGTGSLTTTKMQNLSSITSDLQTQLNNKLSLTGGTVNGAITITNGLNLSSSCFFGRNDGVSTDIFTGVNPFPTHPIGFTILFESASTQFGSGLGTVFTVILDSFTALSNGVWLLNGNLTSVTTSTPVNGMNILTVNYGTITGGTINTSTYGNTMCCFNGNACLPSASFPSATFIATGNGVTSISVNYKWTINIPLTRGTFRISFVATKIA